MFLHKLQIIIHYAKYKTINIWEYYNLTAYMLPIQILPLKVYFSY